MQGRTTYKFMSQTTNEKNRGYSKTKLIVKLYPLKFPLQVIQYMLL
jgi:hypothetical protein